MKGKKEIAIYNIILNYLSEYLINSKEFIKRITQIYDKAKENGMNFNLLYHK